MLYMLYIKKATIISRRSLKFLIQQNVSQKINIIAVF